MKCPERTHRLNCGCCDDVILDCCLEAGHDGAHHCEPDGERLVITWVYMAGHKAGRTGPVKEPQR